MWHEITSIDELNNVLSKTEETNKFYLILKHSTRCSISSMAKGRLEKNKDERLNYYLINVLTHRDVSNALAERTQVQHESPQAFLYKEKELLDVKSHSAIRPEEFSHQMDALIQN